MKSFATIGALGAMFASTVEALIREDRLPLKTSEIKLNTSQAEHTTGRYGQFVHPFRQESPDVQSIYYEDSKTFSKKVHRVAGHDKNNRKVESARAINQEATVRQKPMGIWETIS